MPINLWLKNIARPSVKIEKLCVGIFLLGFLTCGLLVFPHYGTSWDEPMNIGFGGFTTKSIKQFFRGEPMMKFIVNGVEDDHAATHNSGYEIALYIVYRIFQIDTSRMTFLTRHCENFIFFFLGVWAFYRLCRSHFQSRRWGLLGAVFLVLSPRIFADSFYNSVDVGTLCAFIFNAVTFRKYFLKKNTQYLIWHGLSTALLINFRIVGVLSVLCTGLFLLPDFFRRGASGRDRARTVLSFIVYLAISFFVYLVMTPYLWEETLRKLVALLATANRVQLRGNLLYMGQILSVTDLPWHYNFVWILITTPLLYSAAFIIGNLRSLWELARSPKTLLSARANTFFLIWFWLPVIAPILLKTILYDAWRHHFFVYPSFLILALWGLRFLLTFFGNLSSQGLRRWGTAGIAALIVFSVLNTASAMVRYHPYQNVYFNALAGPRSKLIERFDLDYWGLSYRRCLEYLLRADPRPKIRLAIANFPVWCNLRMLTNEEQERFDIDMDVKTSHYFVGNFRGLNSEYPFLREVYSVKVDGFKISAVYRFDWNYPGFASTPPSPTASQNAT